MFHSWQAASPAPPAQPPSRNAPKPRRQSSTAHACEECRRRKIRCDGRLPCSHCEWYKHPERCHYARKPPRVVPSQRLLDELQSSLRRAQSVLAQLFPDQDLGRLGALPREELVGLIHAAGTGAGEKGASSSPSAAGSSPPVKNEELASPFAQQPPPPRSLSSAEESSSAHLEALEPDPGPDADWDEAEKFGRGGMPAVSDDVNALDMSVRSGSSYLGVSSVAAALRVMSKINRALGDVILGNGNGDGGSAGGPGRPSDSSPESLTSPDAAATSTAEAPIPIARPTLKQSVLIDAYFDQVHPLIPMVDESRFRETFASNSRNDKPWRALLYMLLAMGTIAAAPAADNSHLRYYHAVRQLLGLDIFGTGRIEALQALGLLGGFYLHYAGLPNMANAVLGAALRMACALGLHREYPAAGDAPRPDFVRRAALIPREVRRRTWWALFCLDTWATTTQGRPSLGRTGPAVTVLPPAFLGAPPDLTAAPPRMTDDDALVLVLRCETAFCRLATRIQDRLAEAPLLPFDEVVRLDAELRAWRADLPAVLVRADPRAPACAAIPRAVMSWRFHNLRLVLHRPILLNHALRSGLGPGAEAAAAADGEEARLVAACRAIAAENVADIRARWTRCQMSGWNGVWMLFQAAMVPLLTAFAEFNRGHWDEVRRAQRLLEEVMALLAEMREWSAVAGKSLAFVRKMYEKSRGMMEAVEAQERERVEGMARLRVDEEVSGPVPGGQVGGHLGQNMGSIEGMEFGPPGGALAGGALSAAPAPLEYQPAYMAPIPEGMGYTGLDTRLPAPPVEHGFYSAEHTGYMDQAEFQAFWNQVLWGEGEMPDFMMDDDGAGEYSAAQYPVASDVGGMTFGLGHQ